MTTGTCLRPLTVAEAIQRSGTGGKPRRSIIWRHGPQEKLVGVLSPGLIPRFGPVHAEIMHTDVVSVRPRRAARGGRGADQVQPAGPVVGGEGECWHRQTMSEPILPMIWKKRAAKKFI
jgi:hypothetical protein